jgi:hypothetical protein
MCTIAPLTDTTAMVVYSTYGGVRWAIAGGSGWRESGVVDPRRGLHPRLALKQGGGLWLFWTGGSRRPNAHVATFDGTAWTVVDSVVGVHPPGQTLIPAWCDISQQADGPPLLAWGDLGSGFTFRDVGMVSFPTDTGWSDGEEIPGSEGIFLTPRVARDGNGDAWFAHDLGDYDSVIVVHTYTRATASAPSLSPAGSGRRVSWVLSEQAPGSWWTVHRARNDGLFEQVARVQADSSLAQGWTDASPSAGVLRYKLRRECTDARYRWEGPEARWPLRSRRPIHFTQVARPLAPGQSLELSGATAGPVRISLFDIQGRLVYERRWQASGSGIDRIPFDAGRPVGSGVYFLRAVDASGSLSASTRIVLLR